MLKFLVESPYERKLYRLSGDRVVIGRSRAAEIPLMDEGVRKRHVVVEKTDQGYCFRDLSRGETRRNGESAGEGPLGVGDRLELGSTVVTLQAVLSRPAKAGAPAPVGSATLAGLAAPKAGPEVGGRSVRMDPAGDGAMATGSLRSILEINKLLLREQDEDRLIGLVLDSAIDLTGAERGVLVLREGSGLRTRAARSLQGGTLSEADARISRTIALQAIREVRPILSADAGEDDRWSGMESIAALRLRSVLSVPLMTEDGPIGALYLDNRFERGLFSSHHVGLLQAFADQAALAIVNSRLAVEMREKSVELEKTNLEVEKLNLLLAAELESAREDLRSRQSELEYKYDYAQIVGRSPAIREVLKTLDKVTDLNVPVFIEGESGTGKELVARALHFNGPRRGARFITENCSAIPETLIEKVLFGHAKGAFTGADSDAPGLFEQADGGTLFLDEVGDMGSEMQKKILRVLQEGEVRRVGGKSVMQVDARIVCATNRDVDTMKDEGHFREDLYWRLVVVRIRIPPLRRRPEDVPLLLDHFLGLHAKEMGTERKSIDGEALDLLSRYSWPGNVRELSNEIRRAMALAESRITADVLSERVRNAPPISPPDWGEGRPLKEVVEDVEKMAIRRELERHAGNKTRAAGALGLSRLGLRNKIQRYGID